jgi:ArsR family transcriptional regulator, arsenate/arsenite/antimonite-responsive transcriptional repressor
MNETQAVKALAALAHSTRLRVFRELVGAGPAGIHPGALSQTLACAPTALSFHLKELSQAGLVSSEREGRHLVYRAAFAHMNDLLAYLTEHCCQGQPCELAAAACASAITPHDKPQG